MSRKSLIAGFAADFTKPVNLQTLDRTLTSPVWPSRTRSGHRKASAAGQVQLLCICAGRLADPLPARQETLSMGQSYLRPVSGNIAFNAHHSPMGAFFSFTCGHFSTPGGLGSRRSLGPANQDLFIGVKDGDRRSTEPLLPLPALLLRCEGCVAPRLIWSSSPASRPPNRP